MKPGGRLIVCGDNRQLPPIGAGNVFSDVLDKTNVFNILMPVSYTHLDVYKRQVCRCRVPF